MTVSNSVASARRDDTFDASNVTGHTGLELEEREWDVIVVGAGPAGSAAAISLASRGHAVLLLDSQAFPRSKPCGDGLTQASLRLLERLAVLDRVRAKAFICPGLRFVSPSGRQMVLPVECWTIRRRELDAILVDEAVARGARFSRAEVTGIAFGPSGSVQCSLRGKSALLAARYCVCATGSKASLLRSLGMVECCSRVAIAIRGYVQSTWKCDDMIISLEDSVSPGYGWIFPLGSDVYNVGVLVTVVKHRTNKARLTELYRRFLTGSRSTRRLVKYGREIAPPKAALLRYGLEGIQPIAIGNLLPVGDAVGAIVPLSFEGISGAMCTGVTAGDIIHRALERQERLELFEYPLHLQRHLVARYRMMSRAHGVVDRLLENTPHILDGLIGGIPRANRDLLVSIQSAFPLLPVDTFLRTEIRS